MNIPVSNNRLDGYDTRVQMQNEAVFGPRKQDEDADKEDENMHVSKLNVMESEVEDDV